jgi:hypothetical protein
MICLPLSENCKRELQTERGVIRTAEKFCLLRSMYEETLFELSRKLLPKEKLLNYIEMLSPGPLRSL